MINSKKLKIWTIACHFFIVIGFGHGMLTLGILEMTWLPFFSKGGFSLRFNAPFPVRMSAVVFTSFIGQSLIVISMFKLRRIIKIATHLAGLVCLWLSIIYYTYGIKEERLVHFGFITCLPFMICTFITFFGRPVQKLYNWLLEL